MVNILLSWGIRPAAVIGHSSGEVAAAYASGAISMTEAIIIAYYRGRATGEVRQNGGMAAVGLGKDEVNDFLNKDVVVACDNSPQSVTLSGDEDALQAVMKDIKNAKPEAFLRRLKVEMAYHSRKFIFSEFQHICMGINDIIRPYERDRPCLRRNAWYID
jgi:acyl transferase domain-containing protein